MPDANIDLLEAMDAAGILVSMPECIPDNAYELAILARVRDIVSRGKVAVFTRQHRIVENYIVRKCVTNPEPDDLGDLASDNGYVAPWDEAYTLTEEDLPSTAARRLPKSFEVSPGKVNRGGCY